MFNTIVVEPIFNLLLGIYSLVPGGDFGVALIIFTILVRLALWPLVKKQLHQVKAMQKLQPELVRIKKATKGNRQLEGLQMMELYKKHDVNPFRSIGILLIQLPIFIALYQVIQIFAVHRDQLEQFTYGFMRNIGPIKDLIANPDSLNEKFLGFLDLTQQAISSNPAGVNIVLLILAVCAAITQYIMSKQTSPTQGSSKTIRQIMKDATEGKEADQSEMNAAMTNNMIKFMPFMMLVIMVYMPGALVLYYTVSNIVAVFQQGKVLKQDEKEMIEIADKADEVKRNKKASIKARAEVAREANITRIVAKESSSRKNKKKEKRI